MIVLTNLVTVFVTLLVLWDANAQSSLFNRSTSLLAFDLLTKEIERLDAVALDLRKDRTMNWTDVKALLRLELQNASAQEDVVRAFYRLDAAYTNSHAYMELASEVDDVGPRSIYPSVQIFVDRLSLTTVKFRVSSFDSKFYEREANPPREGDEIVSINGRTIREWLVENANFCKESVAAACALQFSVNFFRQHLSWRASTPLKFGLKRGSAVWEIPVGALSNRPAKVEPNLRCAEETSRYKNFRLVYSGNRACVYQSTTSSLALLRITRFKYKNSNGSKDAVACKTNSSISIDSVPSEVECLKDWWIENANWHHLLVDVVDNKGGNDPAPYFKLLFDQPVREDQVLIKKFAEVTDPAVNGSIFYDQDGMRTWFERLVGSSAWSNIREGELFGPVSVYCPDANVDCNQYAVEPFRHNFRGRVSVLLNGNCVSSCDDFVTLLQTRMGPRAKFFGHPNAADGAWGMIRIDILPEGQGVRSSIRSLDSDPEAKPLVSQIVIPTRSIGLNGQFIEGNPVKLTKFLPLTLENRRSWVQLLVDEAVQFP